MYRYNLGLHFETIAEKNADRTALKFSTTHTICYQELNRTANQLARYLLDIGVRPKDVVGISGEKHVNTFACMIACLKIGAAYTILDPESPANRLKKIVEKCQPKSLYISSSLKQEIQSILPELQSDVIHHEQRDFHRSINSYSPENLQTTRSITGEHPAYIMFTSGSTGFPKGALMTHANVLNLINWAAETYKIGPDDILTNVNPLYFDNSVFDVYSSLFSGACMVPFSRETVTDPKLLVNAIDEFECTSWFSVPTLLIFLQTMKALHKRNMKSIRRFIFGGEGYPTSKLQKLYELYSTRATFFNVYGPTECTCICSSYKLSDDDFKNPQGFPPLGRMIENFSYLILDDENTIVSDGEIGELCLLGSNVGKGYYNDPERTHASFVQNPYNDKYREIMYKTGDLVKYRPDDGKIYIMGRKDNQIKHKGYRIELEEIETALSQLEYILQAAVIHGTFRGFSQIVAVVNKKIEKDETEIRHDLQQILPEYMIPTSFHFVNELPKNQNGKVDRRKLQEIYVPHV